MDKKLLLVFALFFVFLLVYSPHFGYPLPFHFDEWTHISRVAGIKEQGISYFFNNSPIQIGFDIILLFISFFVDLIAIYKLLPAINAVIIAVVLFCFLGKKFNYWTGLISIIFLASLKTNANILGLWLYVPVIAAIVFDYLCLFYLDDSIKTNNPKKLYSAVLFLFLIAFIHQSSFLIIFLVVLIYLAFNYKFVIKYKNYFLPFLIVIIVPSIFMLYFLGIRSIARFLHKLRWYTAVTHINFNPFLFYGILLSVFAVIGYYVCYKQKKLLPFRIYILIPLINIFMYPYTKAIFSAWDNFTFFSAYQRHLYHFMIAAVPLSAAGFYYSIKFIKNKLGKYGKNLSYIIIGSILLFSFAAIFYNYYDLDPRAGLYTSILPDEYESLQSLKDYPKGKVLTLIRIGAAIKAVNGHEAVFDFIQSARRNDLDEFYAGNCSIKKEFFYNYYFIGEDIDYVHSKEPISCSFLEEIYANENNFIYKAIHFSKDRILLINRTADFNGTDKIATAKRPFFGADFTFYAWIKPKDESLKGSNITALFDKNNKAVWNLTLKENKLLLNWRDDNKTGGLNGNISLRGEWSFIALAYDGNFSIYVNGELDAAEKAENKYKGRYFVNIGAGYTGEMRQIVLDNRSYSADEIKKLYLS